MQENRPIITALPSQTSEPWSTLTIFHPRAPLVYSTLTPQLIGTALGQPILPALDNSDRSGNDMGLSDSESAPSSPR